jgi:hypothetical protein
MSGKDRMMVPYECEKCGAPLNPKKSNCDYCRTHWEMVKRYNGPELPKMYQPTGWEVQGDSLVASGLSSCVVVENFGTTALYDRNWRP